MVQWLSLCASYTRDMGSIPDWETKIPYSTGCGKKKKKERERNYIVTWLPKNRYIWKIWILASLYGSLLQALFHCWDNPVCYIIVIFSFNSWNMVSLNFLSISVIADLRSWLNTAFGLTQNLSVIILEFGLHFPVFLACLITFCWKLSNIFLIICYRNSCLDFHLKEDGLWWSFW